MMRGAISRLLFLGATPVTLLSLTLGCAGLASRVGATDPVDALRHGDVTHQILVTVDLESSWRPPRAGTSGRVATGQYKPSARTRRLVSELARSYGMRAVSNWPIPVLGIHCVVFEVPETHDESALLERLAGDERVESAQRMNLFETSSHHYNDPYLELQHGVESMEVEEAHRWARGVGVEVAVVDTGIDIEHPELRDHILLARNFVADVDRPTPDLHGTAVAGVIVSAPDNHLGIVGIAPAASIIALQACWQPEPVSPTGVCNSFTLAKSLSFTIERGPHILNLSLAGPSDPLLERLTRAAIDRGIIVVAATSDEPSQPFPAGVPGVLAVRSAGPGGRSTHHPDAPGLVAPGAEIITTTPAGGFDFQSGHSLATAHVSGVVALVLERRPHLKATQLRALLLGASRTPQTSAPGSPPVINACLALARITTGPVCRQ